MTNNYTDWIRLDLFYFFTCPVSCATFVSVSRILVISIWGELWPSLTFDLCPWPPSLCHMMDLCVTHATVLLSPSSSLPLLTPHPYTSFPSNTETDQPSLVWFDRGKFYVTFEGKLGLISKDVARAHSSLIWHLTSPFFLMHSFIHQNQLWYICLSSTHLLCSVFLLCHLTVHLTVTGRFSSLWRIIIFLPSSLILYVFSFLLSCGSSVLISSFWLWSWIITLCFRFRCLLLKLSVSCFNFLTFSLPYFAYITLILGCSYESKLMKFN